MFADIIPDELRHQIERLADDGPTGALDRFWRFARGEDEREPLQHRARFVYPGLPAHRWFDLEAYVPFVRAARVLEAAHPRIKEEFETFARHHDALLTPYLATEEPNPGWKAQYFYRDGERSAEIFERFPRTAAALEDALRDVRYPLGEVHFSILEPGAVIAPHSDPQNFSVSFHLAVITPPDCALKVAGEARPWVEGRCLLFDHSFEHEAWNRSALRRVSLISDVWNPDLSLPEREAVLLVFRWLFAESHAE